MLKSLTQNLGTDPGKIKWRKWITQAPGKGTNSWECFSDQRVSKLEMKDPSHWPFKNGKQMVNQFNKCKQNIIRFFDMTNYSTFRNNRPRMGLGWLNITSKY